MNERERERKRKREKVRERDMKRERERESVCVTNTKPEVLHEALCSSSTRVLGYFNARFELPYHVGLCNGMR